jgi:probable F420-dependent oxidoreductase
MKFGITGVNAGRRTQPENAATIARMAEEAGIESLWTVDHVVVPADYQSKYPYSDTGKMPGREEIAMADPLIWMTFAAAVTERIKLGTGVLILPQRNPAVLAKECASLDLLSGGRLLLGVGVGWLAEEFAAVGVPFEGRGKRADEYIDALRALWLEDQPTFEGDFVTLKRAKSYPKPAQGSIPILVGGHSESAARRAGRLGDGFFPWGVDRDGFLRLVGVMRKAAEDAGRNPDDIEITTGAMTVDEIKAYADEGVERLVVPCFARTEEELKAWFDTFHADVMSKI